MLVVSLPDVRLITECSDDAIVGFYTENTSGVAVFHKETLELRTLFEEESGDWEAEFSPDGQLFALGNGRAGLLTVHRTTTGEEIARLDGVSCKTTMGIGRMYFSWITPDLIRISHTVEDSFHWLDLDVNSRKSHDRGPYSGVWASHSKPPLPGPRDYQIERNEDSLYLVEGSTRRLVYDGPAYGACIGGRAYADLRRWPNHR